MSGTSSTKTEQPDPTELEAERLVSSGAETVTNSLAQAASAYLRSARHQPVAWQQWGAEVFAQAQRENKPVLLDIGAVWCHWCHVMDRESYEDTATAELINNRFIAVKVDRDERPDVDTRYQAGIAAISGQGGWPLTAFLTPEGKPYFGGTYFPPEERYGRPSFQRVLLTMAETFANRRDEVEETAGSVMQAIELNESFAGQASAANAVGTPLLDKMIASALEQLDERNGGFGSQPKFPHAGALDLLLDAASRGGENMSRARHAALLTLRKMAAGGIYDQLAGGFHRYSVDERWIVPHFEKMAYDNSELLKIYAHASQTWAGTAEGAEFARVATDILRWMNEWLSDRERGGFYASQDADASLEDDGDYFTWTRDEAAAVLTGEELQVAIAFYGIRAVGDMHHNPQKNVLRVATSVESIAQADNTDPSRVQHLLDSAKRKMYAARLRRRTPFVDKTIYTGWNGMCISAYLAAGRALTLPAAVEFALRSLDRVLAGAWSVEQGLAHVVVYGGGVAAAPIAGVLEDYGFVANAALDAWEATGDVRYFDRAQEMAERLLARFYDAGEGGFLDTEPDATALGALTARRKPLQDAPTPAGNAVAVTLLLRLHTLTGRDLYATRAQQTLEIFAGLVEHLGLYAASYGLALRRAVEGPLQVFVLGNDALADELAAAAMAGYATNKSVVRLRPEQLGLEPGILPNALSETLPHLSRSQGSVALLCRRRTCLPPISNPAELREALGTG